MSPRAALLLLALALAGLAGCRSGAPIIWGTAPPPTVRRDVVDARGRFREILCRLREVRGALPDDRPCADALVRFPDEPPETGVPVATDRPARGRRIVVVSGIFGECISPWISPYGDARPYLERQGYRTGLIRVSGTAGSDKNAQRIRDDVLQLPDLAADEKVVLVGYSKGAVDILEALVKYPALVARVDAVVSVAGPIGGSPLADGVAPWRRTLIETIASPLCGGGRGAITSLTREERRRFMASAHLPRSVKYFSVIGMVEEGEVSRALRSYYRNLALVDPHTDAQVLPEDGVIPRSVLLGYTRADHWAVALPFSRAGGPLGWLARLVVDRNAFPRELLLEAIVRAVEERL
jgi:pimeloyl-ACP methyl ester carboxylesterase